MSRLSLFRIIRAAIVLLSALWILSCSSSSTDVAVDKTDDISPSTVQDLAVSAFTDHSVTLTWTAPGDDSTSGTASQYDVRYSKNADIWGNWDSATQADDEPSPQPAGETETMTITGLSADTTYYFAMQAGDEEGNWSFISNWCQATCFADFPVEFADANLESAVRAAISKSSGDINKSDLLALVDLDAGDAGISNLSGLEHCIRLQRFFALNNAISDLTPLAALPDVRMLDLKSNAITDISPLVANPGIGELDGIHLENNPLSFEAITDQIPALISRGVVVTWTQDATPPSPVTDLSVSSLDSTSVTFAWTAPGDDGVTGQADLYELRHAPDSLGFSGWTGTALVPGAPSPGPAGTIETMAVDDLETGRTYYFALRTRDESNNWSIVSNIVKVVPFVDMPVTFVDSGLESAVRNELGKPTGEIYESELFYLTTLDAAGYGIADIRGIEKCANLDTLCLNQNQIADISPVSTLVNLRSLEFDENLVSDISPVALLAQLRWLSLRTNQVTDISPVQSLTLLQYLFITENAVTDIGPLSGLSGLSFLEALGNSISDLTPLAGHTNLLFLFLSANNISDITPVASLTGVHYLYLDLNNIVDLGPLSALPLLERVSLRYNSITDISPLVDNSGLGTGDQLWLESNPLSATSIDTHIPALVARGVIVSY